MSRHRRRHPARLILLGGAILVTADLALWVLWALAHVLPLLVVLAVAGLAAAVWFRRRRAVRAKPVKAKVIRVSVGGPDTDRLRAENAELRARLADAQRSAHLAWDMAASVPSRPATAPAGDVRGRLLATPLSGASPLGDGK